MGRFSHLTKEAQGTMVDVSSKPESLRRAIVTGFVQISNECADQLTKEMVAEMITTARIAGIQAAKQTGFFIPYCHPIFLQHVEVLIELDNQHRFTIQAQTTAVSTTGVEIEAFVAAQIAGTTLYDMIKSVDRSAVVGPFSLQEKQGGKTGLWTR